MNSGDGGECRGELTRLYLGTLLLARPGNYYKVGDWRGAICSRSRALLHHPASSPWPRHALLRGRRVRATRSAAQPAHAPTTCDLPASTPTNTIAPSYAWTRYLRCRPSRPEPALPAPSTSTASRRAHGAFHACMHTQLTHTHTKLHNVKLNS